ncbi:MAG TPA: thioredoxin domain-containing protein [Propionibacteriaceae bacterium]|nr:thioredoxin domain-containing protein [Propionibacteriaceae bacterium]
MSAHVEQQAAQRRRDRRLLGLVALTLVLVLVGGGLAWQQWRTGRAPAAVPGPNAGFGPVSVVPGKPLVLGQSGAPVRLTLYEDFHCRHCADFEEKLGPAVTAEQNAGRLVVELYPMSFVDAGSASAANAMACAAENGFGPAYYRGLFANSTLRWNDSQLLDLATKVLSAVPAASETGRQSFSRCVTDRAHASWVQSINSAAQAAGVTATPTVFLDGRPVDWATLTPDTLRSRVDQAASS